MKNPLSCLLSRRFLSVAALTLCILNGRSAQAADVLTQHNDQFRSGANLSEIALTTANVNSNQFGKLYSYAVDGYVYAQPLYVSGLNIAGGQHNVLYVATMEDSVYAFDADSNQTYWRKQFTGGNITPVPIADVVGSSNLNIHGDVGIVGTPVIDRASSTIYLLARTKNTSNNTYLQALHALDLATGAEKFGGPVNITAAGFNAKLQNQRPGLGLFNGKVYISWGSHEDKNPYHGYVISYDAATLAQRDFFNTTAGGSQAAIWQAGQAPAIDGAGNLYLTTGNGDWNGTTQWGETCLKLSPTLGVLDWFTPANYASLNARDDDFGAAGCLLLPGPSGYPATSYVITGGKEGKLFVMNKGASMGHTSSGDAGVHQAWQAVQTSRCSHHIHGTPIYWNSAALGQLIYAWGENDVGKAFKFDGTKFNTTPAMQTAVTSPTTGCGMPGSILSLSANGNTNGILWANCVYTGDAIHDIVPGVLRAYDANNLSKELWNSYQNKSRDNSGNLAKYVPPTVANGKVYLATFSNTVCVYGALSSVTPPVADGTYKIISRNSGLALGVKDGSAANSAPTQQQTYTAAGSQQWAVSSIGGGSYKIIGVASGKALDVAGESNANGAVVGIYPFGAAKPNQQWVISPTTTPGYYTVRSVKSGLFLDVIGVSAQPNVGVQQWQATGGNNQQWSFQAP